MNKETIEIHIDKALRSEAQAVCEPLGMDLSTVIRLFLKELVAQKKMPLQPKADMFESAANMQHLKSLHDDYVAGRNIVLRDLIDEPNSGVHERTLGDAFRESSKEVADIELKIHREGAS